MTTLLHTARALHDRTLSARAHVEAQLARINDAAGQGPAAFMQVHAASARAAADAIDAARNAGRPVPPLAGLTMSIKDLFDEAGQITRAGSRALADAAPADADAPAIANARASGLIGIGRTVMTEFAFSGVGINPHYGTPLNPFDRAAGRIPGGSSSGAVVSVTDGMADIGVGSDTGGSCRIPAALCGVVGVKPSQALIARTGTVPLSSSLDTVGVMARSIDDARLGVRALAGLEIDLAEPAGLPLAGLRFGVLEDYVTGGMDAHVAQAFESGVQRLEAQGAIVRPCPFPELANLPRINARGGFPAPESLAWHEALIARAESAYDPFVLRRILRGREQSAVDYIRLLDDRARLIAIAADRMAGFDAILMPTVPITAPTIADLAADEAHLTAINLLLLRNTTVVNFLDACAVTLPCHAPGAAPVGLGIMAANGADARLFAVARAAERALTAT